MRPLDERGRRQAEALVETLLAAFELDRIVSSPYLRCVQTVEPLAAARGLEIELDEQLGADAARGSAGGARALRRRQNVVVCTHGDLPWLGERKFKKGATWVRRRVLEPVRYIPPPACEPPASGG